MATTVKDRDQAARPRARWVMSAYRWLLLVLAIVARPGRLALWLAVALDGLLTPASAGVQYVLVRRR